MQGSFCAPMRATRKAILTDERNGLLGNGCAQASWYGANPRCAQPTSWSPSNRTSLIFRRNLYLSCAVERHVFTKSSSLSSLCSFPDWATPVKLCSVLMCMLINCRLQHFLSSLPKGVRIPYQVHLVNELKRQGVDACLCLLAISLTTCRIHC